MEIEMDETGVRVTGKKWCTMEDVERLQKRYPWINHSEYGYISPHRRDPEFVAEVIYDYYETWAEGLVDLYINTYSDERFAFEETTYGEVREDFRRAEHNRLLRVPK